MKETREHPHKTQVPYLSIVTTQDKKKARKELIDESKCA